MPQLQPHAAKPYLRCNPARSEGVTPIIVRPLVSKLKVATTGRPVVRAPATAASLSSMDDIVSIHRKSAPPRARAAACSLKASRASVGLKGPSGSRISPRRAHASRDEHDACGAVGDGNARRGRPFHSTPRLDSPRCGASSDIGCPQSCSSGGCPPRPRRRRAAVRRRVPDDRSSTARAHRRTAIHVRTNWCPWRRRRAATAAQPTRMSIDRSFRVFSVDHGAKF